MSTASRVSRFAVGGHGDRSWSAARRASTRSIEHVVWSERDRCHYFYLVQPHRKLSRGYRADELADGFGDTLG